MHFNTRSLDFFVDTFSVAFNKESSNFNKHIQKLTSNWSASGFALNSLLTPNKSAIEFNYNFNNPSLSYTLDIGLATDPPYKKRAFLDTFFEASVFETYPLLKPFSLDVNQKFGLWLSVRHILEHSYYKVYQEVSLAMQNEAKHCIFEQFPELHPIPFNVKLIGVMMPTYEQPEYYLSFGSINESRLFDIMKLAGVQEQTPYFISQLGALRGKSYDFALNNIKFGASLKMTKSKPILTLFFHAPELFSNNSIAITKMKKLALELKGDITLYEAITKNILNTKVEIPIHSVLSFKFFEKEAMKFSVGISPY